MSRERPPATPRIERQLANLIAGRDGGWSLWLAALVGLEEAVADSRQHGHDRFESWPQGELNRLLGAVENALDRATLAVEVRDVFERDEYVVSPETHRYTLAELLLHRATEQADWRTPVPPRVEDAA